MSSTNLARYACDYCKQKKFRCSKELPKCGACKPWPGPCNYSRDIPGVSARPMMTASEGNHLSAGDIHTRLQNIEKAVQELTGVISKAVTYTNEVSLTRQEKQDDMPIFTSESNNQAPRLHVGQSNSFSVLVDVLSHMNQAVTDLPSSLHRNARNGLEYLSSSLTTAPDGEGIRQNEFFIPARAEGYKLIGQFLENTCLGDTFFTYPAEDILIQVMFKPETVSRKAWVVYVNYMILALLSGNQSTKCEGFRHNMKLALNDSRIFLEPHQIHLQTLVLLAVHGEDYAFPNLSWMLVGHACRQAEALGLHLPGGLEYEARQRRLSLFWMLFAIDKSCALAFGRPCFLLSATYADVPLPDLAYLTQFQPRDKGQCSAGGQVKSKVFRAHMFLARIELAKLIGRGFDLLNHSLMGQREDQLNADLREWHIRVLREILNKERVSSDANQIREMTLGINTINFEYLHVLMVFTKADPSSVDTRLGAAREAVTLLPSMVSNWMSVYNTMIWHLLYFPFIPFLIIFDNLTQRHSSSSKTAIQQDIELMLMTKSYYTSMRGQLQLLAPLCERLENIAEVFHRLAQVQLAHYGGSEAAESTDASKRQNVGLSDNDATISLEQMQVELGDEFGNDLKYYLDWLPENIFPAQTAISLDAQAENLTDLTYGKDSAGELGERPTGMKRPFDAMFDWFAWDIYYADNSG